MLPSFPALIIVYITTFIMTLSTTKLMSMHTLMLVRLPGILIIFAHALPTRPWSTGRCCAVVYSSTLSVPCRS